MPKTDDAALGRANAKTDECLSVYEHNRHRRAVMCTECAAAHAEAEVRRVLTDAIREQCPDCGAGNEPEIRSGKWRHGPGEACFSGVLHDLLRARAEGGKDRG